MPGYCIENNKNVTKRRAEMKWNIQPIVSVPENHNTNNPRTYSKYSSKNTDEKNAASVRTIITTENRILNHVSFQQIKSKSPVMSFDSKKIDKIWPLSVNQGVKQEKEEPKPDANRLSGQSLLFGALSLLFGVTGFLGSILLFYAAALNILSTLSIIGVLALILVAIGLAILSFSLSHEAHLIAKSTNNDNGMIKAVAGVVLSIIGLIFSAIGLIIFLAVV